MKCEQVLKLDKLKNFIKKKKFIKKHILYWSVIPLFCGNNEINTSKINLQSEERSSDIKQSPLLPSLKCFRFQMDLDGKSD